MPKPFHKRPILLACLIISIGQLSMGLIFPALPGIAHDFNVSLDEAQLLVAIYLLGFGPSQFIYGPISDALGRKKVLLTGLLLALAGLCLVIASKESLYGMVAGRFIQGLGTGCCAVLARASTRDSYSGEQLPTALSYLAMVASITPMFAPVIGGLINHHLGWPMVFVTLLSYVALAWCAISMLFKETMTKRSRVPNPKKIVSQYGQLLRSRYFVSFASISWLNFSLVVTLISVMPFIMQNQIGMTSDEYALWAIIPALGMFLGTALTSRLRPMIGIKKMLLCTPMLHALAAIWLCLAPLEPLAMMFGQLIMVIGNGIALPCSQAMVMQPFQHQAGAAAALAGGGQMIISSFVSMALVQLGISQSWHLGLVIGVFACITLTNILRGFNAPKPEFS
ncbi:multidrug effflux MFS transporter [Thaumasiovibrio subtropicus]|uniref:multidrug effflux MFS transporter n=1 Tax=Thaumasiovibrio subtropicus TaxID=1891207 RepID=UPI000B357B07|nr:multidrug effflux MFS transporter [Thaumasiovibrio subtropicus]